MEKVKLSAPISLHYGGARKRRVLRFRTLNVTGFTRRVVDAVIWNNVQYETAALAMEVFETGDVYYTLNNVESKIMDTAKVQHIDGLFIHFAPNLTLKFPTTRIAKYAYRLFTQM